MSTKKTKDLAKQMLYESQNSQFQWDEDFLKRIIDSEDITQHDQEVMNRMVVEGPVQEEPYFRFTGTLEYLTREDYDRWHKLVTGRMVSGESISDEVIDEIENLIIKDQNISDSKVVEMMKEEFKILLLDLEAYVKTFKG